MTNLGGRHADALEPRPPWLHDDPHAWRTGTLDRAGLTALALERASEPGFTQRAQRFADCWLRTQASHPELRAVFRNTPRYLLLVASLVLHHRRDPGDATSGVTAGKLLLFFEHTAGPLMKTSPGQVKAMLAHARLQGLLQPAAEATVSDRRLRRLEPSSRLEQIFATWVGGFVAAMDGEPSTWPLPLHPGTVLTTRAVVAEMFSYRMAAISEDRFMLFEGIPRLRWVLAHDHGYRLMLHLVRAARPTADRHAAVPVPQSKMVLAQMAGVSRTHLRNMLAGAKADGWLHSEGPNEDGSKGAASGASPNALSLQPEAWATALEWIARELVWMHGLLLAAHRRVG